MSARYPGLGRCDEPLYESFAEAGFRVTVEAWDEIGGDSRADIHLIRTPWDVYQQDRTGQFREWLDKMSAAPLVFHNPPEKIAWNFHKKYLLEMRDAGLPVVPLELLPSIAAVERTVLKNNWLEFVVKPAIGGGAVRTHRLSPETFRSRYKLLEAEFDGRDIIVQPFMKEIESAGELSVIFFKNRFSHAVRKTARKGDFRIQSTYGGTYVRVEPSAAAMKTARAVIERFAKDLLYARVDGIESGGQFPVTELEIFEPDLYFNIAPDTARNLVNAVRELLP